MYGMDDEQSGEDPTHVCLFCRSWHNPYFEGDATCPGCDMTALVQEDLTEDELEVRHLQRFGPHSLLIESFRCASVPLHSLASFRGDDSSVFSVLESDGKLVLSVGRRGNQVFLQLEEDCTWSISVPALRLLDPDTRRAKENAEDSKVSELLGRAKLVMEAVREIEVGGQWWQEVRWRGTARRVEPLMTAMRRVRSAPLVQGTD